jgi:hypothetical protein
VFLSVLRTLKNTLEGVDGMKGVGKRMRKLQKRGKECGKSLKGYMDSGRDKCKNG